MKSTEHIQNTPCRIIFFLYAHLVSCLYLSLHFLSFVYLTICKKAHSVPFFINSSGRLHSCKTNNDLFIYLFIYIILKVVWPHKRMVHTQPCLCTCDQPYRAQVHLLQLDMQRDWLAISENVQNIVVFKTKF